MSAIPKDSFVQNRVEHPCRRIEGTYQRGDIPLYPFRQVTIAFLCPLQYLVIVLLVAIDSGGYIVKPEFTLFAAGEHHVGQNPCQPPVSILKGVDGDKPKMGNGRANQIGVLCLAVKPVDESVHLSFYSVGLGSHIVHPFAPEIP